MYKANGFVECRVESRKGSSFLFLRGQAKQKAGLFVVGDREILLDHRKD